MAVVIFKDAVETAKRVPHIMTRVLITDGGDEVAKEWPDGSSS